MIESSLTDSLSLELDGKINVVFRKNGIDEKTELDGQMCMDALVKILELTMLATMGPGRDA